MTLTKALGCTTNALAIFGLLCTAFFTACAPGCGPSSTPPADKSASVPSATADKTAPAPAATTPAPAVDPASAATITGKVAFSGTEPPKVVIRMEADPNCKAIHGTNQVFTEDVVVNANKTLRNVLVYVSAGVTGTFPIPAETWVLDQKGCQYHPHVWGVRVRQKGEILSSDATNHNVHPLPKNSKLPNMGMPNKGEKRPITITKAEFSPPVQFKCDVHPWMTAYCGAFDHPFFAVTDDQGNFKIGGLPPGKYTLTAWHEKYGEQKKEVEVAAKDSKAVDFDYKG